MTAASPLVVASEVIRLLERAEHKDAQGRTLPTASADLRRAVNLLERDLLGGRPGARRLAYGEALDGEGVARVDAALARFLVHPLHYNCTPMCCDASAIRWRQICTLSLALRVAATWRPPRPSSRSRMLQSMRGSSSRPTRKSIMTTPNSA